MIVGLNTPVFALDAPTLTTTTSGVAVSFSWSSAPGATGYIIYYAPCPYTGPNSIGSLNVGEQTDISGDLWDGAAFYLAMKSSNGAEESVFSNIESIFIDIGSSSCDGDHLDQCASECACSAAGGYWRDDSCDSAPAPDKNDFVRRLGRGLVVGSSETPVILRGINLTNQYWWETHEELMNSVDHGDADFQRIADMGFNSIRFGLSYRMFENDANPGVFIESGFDWLDSEIELARAAGLYLILDMHLPQSGFQGGAEGGGIWTDAAVENRFIALWTEIARRYKNETIIAGYDLMNEPLPYDSASEWQTLAQAAIDGIRTVDENHLIIVEAIIDLRNDPGGAALPGGAQILVEDENVMYDFHFYHPEDYISQLRGEPTWAIYPDENAVELPLDMESAAETPDQPSVAVNTTGWREYIGPPYKVENTEVIGGYALLESNDNSGKAYFDDIAITEYDATGAFVRVIETLDLSDADDWEYFTHGASADFLVETNTGHGDSTSFSIGGHTLTAAWFSLDYFPVKTGYQYQVSGWMKGEDIPTWATAQIKLGFSKSASGRIPMPRTKAYLEYVIDQWLVFGATHNVPMQVGEFGITPETIESAGGDAWLADMFDILNDRGVCFGYWAYHDDASGIYNDLYAPPDPADANQTVVRVITEALTPGP